MDGKATVPDHRILGCQFRMRHELKALIYDTLQYNISKVTSSSIYAINTTHGTRCMVYKLEPTFQYASIGV